MIKPIRMLDLISELRAARGPLTAADLARRLNISIRTLYRDVAALQAMGVPIDGEAGVGYILRPGFHLPPLNFTPDEAEAITVGLALLRRTGDASLISAAERVAAKIAAVQPEPSRQSPQERLRASPWHALPDSSIDAALLRRAIRDCRVLSLEYRDPDGRETHRDVLPIVLLYFVDGTVLAAWCTLRQAFRHFRIDRITACTPTTTSFAPDAARLRRDWATQNPHEIDHRPPRI